MAALRPKITIDLGSSLVVLFWGAMPKMSVDIELESREDGTVQMNVSSQEGMHPHAPTTLIMTPLRGGRNNESITNARDVCEVTMGLLSLHSQSLVAQLLEEYVVNAKDGGIQPTAIEIKIAGKTPAVATSLAEAFEGIARTINGRSDSSRIGLALRWLSQSKRADGIDTFLKAWFAIETIAMPNSSNIRPLNETLGRIYTMTPTDARRHFLTGLLYGLRAKVVHDGDTEPVQPSVVAYMHALFADLFFAALAGPPTRLAQGELDSHPEIAQYLRERLSNWR